MFREVHVRFTCNFDVHDNVTMMSCDKATLCYAYLRHPCVFLEQHQRSLSHDNVYGIFGAKEGSICGIMSSPWQR